MKPLFANKVAIDVESADLASAAAETLHQAIDLAVTLANTAYELGGSPEEIRGAFLLSSVTLSTVTGIPRDAYLGLVDAFWQIIDVDAEHAGVQAAGRSGPRESDKPPSRPAELSLAVFEAARQTGAGDLEIAITLVAGAALVSKTIGSSFESLDGDAGRLWSERSTVNETPAPSTLLRN